MPAAFRIFLSHCKIKGGKHIQISDLLSPLLNARTSAARVETNWRPIAPPGNIEIRRSLANHFGVKKPSYLSPDKKVPFAKVMRKKVGESTTQAPALTERFKDFSDYRKLNKDKFTGDNFSKVKALREKHDFEYM